MASKYFRKGKFAIKLHNPFSVNEFNDWFLFNLGFRLGTEDRWYGFFLIILNCGIEVYYDRT